VAPLRGVLGVQLGDELRDILKKQFYVAPQSHVLFLVLLQLITSTSVSRLVRTAETFRISFRIDFIGGGGGLFNACTCIIIIKKKWCMMYFGLR
jgi:hypothetical protein